MNINKIALLLLFASCSGCVNEDRGGCPSGLYVTFETRNPKHVYTQAVRNVALYFYDADGNLAAEYDYAKADLRVSDGAAFVPDPPQGEYLLLAVVNDGADVNSVEVGNYSTIRSEFKEELMPRRLTDFFSAAREITVTRAEATELMTLDKHNNDVWINVEYGTYVPPTGTTIEAYITCSNGIYQFFDRKCIDPCMVHYQSWDSANDTQGRPVRFAVSTMHIWQKSAQRDKCDVTVCLRESGPTMADERTITINLTDELLKIIDPVTGEPLYDTDEELLFEDEYELTITLDSEFKVIALTINDWAVIKGGVVV